MQSAINQVEEAFKVLNRNPWSNDEKVWTRFLPRVFALYFERLKLDNRMTKSNFHTLADFVSRSQIDPQIEECLSLIANEANDAKPRTS